MHSCHQKSVSDAASVSDKIVGWGALAGTDAAHSARGSSQKLTTYTMMPRSACTGRRLSCIDSHGKEKTRLNCNCQFHAVSVQHNLDQRRGRQMSHVPLLR